MKTGLASIRTYLGSLIAGKSVSSLAWMRGDDVVDGKVTRYVEPYGQSGYIYAAVNLISGEFAGLPLKFYRGDVEHQDAKLESWWEAPALGHDGNRIQRADVDRWLSLWLQLQGEYFILLDDSWILASLTRDPSKLSPFIIARPDRIRLIVQGAKVQGYEYIDPAGRRSVYLPEQVIHRMEPNPYDDFRGLGRQHVARVPAEGVFLTGVYIRDLMRNNGDQGFIVVGKNGAAVDGQREQIIADLRAKRAALRAGVAKDLFLTGEITVERPQERAAGADLSNTTTLSAQEIFLIWGVPPSMSTVKQAYSLGKDSDRYQLVTGTSQPVSRQICGAYAVIASRQTRLALTAEHDWDQHPVLQQVRRERIDAGIKLWQSGIPWEKINDYLDLGLAKFDGWDVGYLPFSVSPVGESGGPVSDPAADPTLAEPTGEEDDQVRMLRLMVLSKRRALQCQRVKDARIDDELSGFVCGCHGSVLVTAKDQDPRNVALWRKHMRSRLATVKAFRSAFGRILMAARIETLRKIEGAEGKAFMASRHQPDAVAKAGTADQLLFDLQKFGKAVSDTFINQHKSAWQTVGEQLFEELDRSDPFKSAPAEVMRFLQARENRMKDVPQEIYDRIKAEIEEGLDAGESIDELSARIKGEFNAINDGQARTIAMTETSAVYGAGRASAMKQAGVLYKAWLTSGNANVRSAHQQAGLDYPSERGIPLDSPFIVDGEALQYPGDPAGSPGNVINCHCVQIATATGSPE